MSALSPLADSNANYAFSARLLRDLADAGVVHFALCAGSRSAPLSAAAATTPGLDWSTHVDERSAGFFALGVARASRRPAALICTSGTAGANFLPAVAEASRADVPLVVLTADRPAELRDRGAPQTIDQVALFGSHVRWFHEAPAPGEVERPERLARSLAERAMRESSGRRPGPIHLNLPFREPLDPSGTREPGVETLPQADISAVANSPPIEVPRLTLATVSRPVFVVGPWDGTESEARALLTGAARLGAPVLAEPLAGLMPFADNHPLIGCADAMLRSESFATRMVPDFVVRCGAPPTSKAVNRWISRHRAAPMVAIDPTGRRDDPDLRVDHWVDAAFRDDLSWLPAGDLALDWLPAWEEASKRSGDAIESVVRAGVGVTPANALPIVAAALPRPSTVVLANSLAVRDAETYLQNIAPGIRFLGNRGANGIDGLLSTALGVAEATGEPVSLWTGDLALLHDAGAWWTARRRNLDVRVVVFNDGGGGIFDHLPIAAQGKRVAFEEVFRVAHTQRMKPIATAYGCEAQEIKTTAEIAPAISQPGPRLIEICFDAAENLAQHRAVWQAVSRTLGEA